MSPALQVAINAYKFASAPEPTRNSENSAPKTSHASAEVITSIFSIASRPTSYLSPGCPSDARDPMPEDRSASARGFNIFVAGFKFIESTS